MFDNLHDPAPPVAGLEQLARVATRAQQIRRRRHQLALHTTVVACAVLGIGALLTVVPGDGSSPAPSNTLTMPEITTPASSTTVPAATTTSVPPGVPFSEAASIDELPPIQLGGQPIATSPIPDGHIEVFDDATGAVCISIVEVSAESCAPSGTSFHSLTWTVDGIPRVAILVDARVNVAFVAVEVACTSIGLPVDAPVDLWTCTGFETERAYVEVLEPTQIIVGVPARER